jgi:hypothetical protein
MWFPYFEKSVLHERCMGRKCVSFICLIFLNIFQSDDSLRPYAKSAFVYCPLLLSDIDKNSNGLTCPTKTAQPQM